jgi:hypothetical protein
MASIRSEWSSRKACQNSRAKQHHCAVWSWSRGSRLGSYADPRRAAATLASPCCTHTQLITPLRCSRAKPERNAVDRPTRRAGEHDPAFPSHIGSEGEREREQNKAEQEDHVEKERKDEGRSAGRATRGVRTGRGRDARRGPARDEMGWKAGKQAGRQAGRPARHTLGAEAVEGAALALEGVDDVEGGNRLALRVLGVSDRVADDVCRGGGRGGDDGEVSDWLPTSSSRGSPQAGGETHSRGRS